MASRRHRDGREEWLGDYLAYDRLEERRARAALARGVARVLRLLL